MTISDDQWKAVRVALRDTSERFTELVSSAPDPQAMATREWTVAQTAAHVAAIAGIYTAIVRSDDTPWPIPALREPFLSTTVETTARFNEQTLALFTQRDPQAIAAGLSADVEDILRAADGLDPTQPVAWLGDSRVPRAGVLAHLVNELQIHGRDIAGPVRASWPIPSRDAAMFFELFLIGMLRRDYGRLFDDAALPKREHRIAVEFRSAYTTPVTLVLGNGKVWVEEPGNADVRLTFDPTALHLMLFHRFSLLRTALTGKVRVGGPRPWLLRTFLRTVRLP